MQMNNDLISVGISTSGASAQSIHMDNSSPGYWGSIAHPNNPYIYSQTGINSSPINNEMDTTKSYFVELITERVYKISMNDFNYLANSFSYAPNKGLMTIELSERTIDYHKEETDGSVQQKYKYLEPIIKKIPVDKILSMWSE